MDLGEIRCENRIWMELVPDRVQWWALVLWLSHIRVLLALC